MSLRADVFEQTLGDLFAPIAGLLNEPGVSEIMINAYDEIYIERGGLLELSSCQFSSEDSLMAALRNLSQFVGRELNERTPILEARLPDGSRVEAVVSPASPRGPTACIRRFLPAGLTLERLIDAGAVSTETAELLKSLVRQRYNVVVGGGSGTGKTSLLNVLVSLARKSERVVVIEDSKELQLRLPHVVHLEAQPADSRGRNAISVRQLFNATLRMRPDRIVIGEIRGGEALDLVQAMTSGHRGCLATVHGTLPVDTLARIETMALMSDLPIPTSVIRDQIASAIDIVVQVSRAEDGRRRVSHITEVLGIDDRGAYRLRPLFEAEGTR